MMAIRNSYPKDVKVIIIFRNKSVMSMKERNDTKKKFFNNNVLQKCK